MILYVMRHGPAEDRSSTGADFDRRLTADGKAVVARAAMELRRLRGSAPLPRIFASPLARAHETAEIVRLHVGDPAIEVELRDELADHSLPLDLVGGLRDGGDDALLVGHQPTVEHLVRELLREAGAGRSLEPLARGFSTAMIVALDAVPPPRVAFRLAGVVDPRAPVGAAQADPRGAREP